MIENTVKKYRLLKKYESPKGTCHIGVVLTTKEWQRWFPDLKYEDFDIKDDWFGLVIEKPPLGIIPEFIWREKRMDELQAAINRYDLAGLKRQPNWVLEYSQHREWLHNWNYNRPTPTNVLNEGQDWEIVSVCDTDGGKPSDKKSGDRYMWSEDSEPRWYNLAQCFDDGCKIHPVRRNSDNEVFTVGDEVRYKKASYGSYIITNFFIKDNGKILARSEGNNYCEYIDENLEKVKLPSPTKEPEPRFTKPEYLEAQIDAFKAGREKARGFGGGWKYPSPSDYLNQSKTE